MDLDNFTIFKYKYLNGTTDPYCSYGKFIPSQKVVCDRCFKECELLERIYRPSNEFVCQSCDNILTRQEKSFTRGEKCIYSGVECIFVEHLNLTDCIIEIYGKEYEVKLYQIRKP